MDHTSTLTAKVTIRVHLLRSTTAQRCSQCGLRRILIAVAIYPAGLSPEVWMCAECAGIRLPGGSVDPSPVSGDPEPTLWDQSADLDYTEEEIKALAPKSLAEGGNVFYAEDHTEAPL